jgi:hypothetical protein
LNVTKKKQTINKAAKIRELLASGLSAKIIAKKTDTSEPYVWQVRWHAEQRLKKKKATMVKQAAKTGTTAKKELQKVVKDWWQQELPLTIPLAGAPSTTVTSTAPLHDSIHHPAHYTAGGVETWDFIEAKNLPYHLASVVKYVSRAEYKNDTLTDLEKAEQHLSRHINMLRRNRIGTQG